MENMNPITAIDSVCEDDGEVSTFFRQIQALAAQRCKWKQIPGTPLAVQMFCMLSLYNKTPFYNSFSVKFIH